MKRQQISVNLGAAKDALKSLAEDLNMRPGTLAAQVLRFFLEQNKIPIKSFSLSPVKAKRGLYLRLDDDELKYVDLLAMKLQKNRQQAIIALIESIIRTKPLLNENAEKELRESNFQLARIGANLNQITRFLNSIDETKIYDSNLKSHLATVKTEQLKLVKALRSHTDKVWKLIKK